MIQVALLVGRLLLMNNRSSGRTSRLCGGAAAFSLTSALIVLVAFAWLQRPDGALIPDEIASASGGWVVVWLHDGPTHTELDPATNYLVMLPEGPKSGPTVLEGGHNVIVTGGHIVMSGGDTDLERRALYIKDTTGTIRIQDLFIEGVGNTPFDAIAISAPEAVVELLNVRVEDVRGTFAGFHGDIVQPFGGVRKLYVNGLTGYSSYQGFYLAQTNGPIGSVELWNVNLGYNPNPDDTTTYLLWLEGCSTYPVKMRNVYIEPRKNQRVVSHAVQPNTVEPRQCQADQEGNEVGWPNIPDIDGTVIEGTPPGGDFVPARRWEIRQPDRVQDGRAPAFAAISSGGPATRLHNATIAAVTCAKDALKPDVDQITTACGAAITIALNSASGRWGRHDRDVWTAVWRR